MNEGGTMTEFEARVLADLSVLKNQMANLMDGPAGRLPMLEADVSEHCQSLERAKGFACAFGLLFTVVQIVLAWLHR